MDSDASPDLAKIRAAIDAIDGELLRLIEARAALAQAVRDAKAGARPAKPRWICPEREANILRRLAAERQGRFPLPALMQIWHELIGGMIRLEHSVRLAASEPLAGLARAAFGAVAQVDTQASAQQVLFAVRAETADAGLVPWPEAEEDAPWWRNMLEVSGSLQVSAALPFLRPEYSKPSAVFLAAQPAFPSGDDMQLLAARRTAPASRSALTLLVQTIDPEWGEIIALHGEWALLQMQFIESEQDDRLAQLCSAQGPFDRVRPLGLYPRPLTYNPDNPDASSVW